jgi:hypothetical protein
MWFWVSRTRKNHWYKTINKLHSKLKSDEHDDYNLFCVESSVVFIAFRIQKRIPQILVTQTIKIIPNTS